MYLDIPKHGQREGFILYIGGSSDVNVLEKMCAAMDGFIRQNQILEDKVLHTWQRQQETNPIEEM